MIYTGGVGTLLDEREIEAKEEVLIIAVDYTMMWF
jgi:hypothetical protein